jgi:hypothetical protein
VINEDTFVVVKFGKSVSDFTANANRNDIVHSCVSSVESVQKDLQVEEMLLICPRGGRGVLKITVRARLCDNIAGYLSVIRRSVYLEISQPLTPTAPATHKALVRIGSYDILKVKLIVAVDTID